MKKIINFFKNNLKIFIAFLVGAIIFSGVGYVVAVTIQSSDVSYTGNGQTNVKGAVDYLYQKCSVASQITYRYWNNNYTYQLFKNNSYPTGAGLRGTYNSREELANAYGSSNFNTRPIYIKTILYNKQAVQHSVCLWYNNKELCLEPYYWVGTIGVTDANAEINTMNKLKTDMESLGLTSVGCSSYVTSIRCTSGTISCVVGNDNSYSCSKTNAYTNGCNYTSASQEAYCQ